jgi:hypothetical protein
MQDVMFYEALPILVYALGVIGAMISGTLVYYGLSTQTELVQNRLRIKQTLRENQEKIVKSALSSNAEQMLKTAGYPFGINALKYFILYSAIITFLALNYIVFPIAAGDGISKIAGIGVIVTFVLLMPSFPYSLFKYFVNRAIAYKQTRKNQEIFMFYDLLINEIQMMNHTRINTYSLLKGLRPYFEVINQPMTKLLTTWGNDEGPEIALDRFAEEIDTKETRALITVLKTLDENDRDTALKALRSMSEMFVRSQIENYRRKRKVTTDLSTLPIKLAHFLILVNFLVVVVYMVANIMAGAR